MTTREAALKKVARIYEREARIYDRTRWFTLPFRNRAIALLQCAPGNHVLEVGCGTGRQLLKIHPLLGGSGHLTGIDFSEAMLARAREKTAGLPGLTLIQGDAATYIYKDEFDKVLFADALTMIPGWQAALENALAALQPGGRAVALDFKASGRWPWRWLNGAWVRWSRAYGGDFSRDALPLLKAQLKEVQVREYLGGFRYIATGIKSPL